MARYLVTGGAGFIGSNLVDALLDAGHYVSVLDDFSTGHCENLRPHKRLTTMEGSVCDPSALSGALAGAEVVFHQAALPSVPRSVDNPRATCRANIEGAALLLHAAREAGVRRVVAASSSSVYGDTPTLPKTESMAPNPLSPYAVSKLAMEHICTVYHRSFGLETVVLRYFNVFGPRQDPQSQYAAVIPIFIDACRNGRAPTIYGDGDQSRDFTYIDNVVKANILAAEAAEAPGKVFNVACGERYTVNRLARLVGEYAGADQQPQHGRPRPGDVKHSQADISLARSVLGYEPEVSFEEGLRRTVQWHMEAFRR